MRLEDGVGIRGTMLEGLVAPTPFFTKFDGHLYPTMEIAGNLAEELFRHTGPGSPQPRDVYDFIGPVDDSEARQQIIKGLLDEIVVAANGKRNRVPNSLPRPPDEPPGGVAFCSDICRTEKRVN